MMKAGADSCTGLNSDEDNSLQEEPEDEEDAEEHDDDEEWMESLRMKNLMTKWGSYQIRLGSRLPKAREPWR
ncbi:unnamed protein product [Phytophthora lilii]|uniref:Unnamed protein product n=1 Tax=Phytophthora lilii TaxID=2077276 RepID=A0A9W6UD74_9STRA|nr:unnamed protein product [Phytophthora lilii]